MPTNYSYHIQEQIARAIREFFYSRKFHEIIPPVFSDTIPLEPNIYPFVSLWHPAAKTKTQFMSTSPERSLKIALAHGVGNCFAVGHSFRDLEGSSPIHSPEFLMLEWYRADASYKDIMHEAQELIVFVVNGIEPHPKPLLAGEGSRHDSWPTLSLVDLFQTHANLSISDIVVGDTLYKKASKKGYVIKNTTWSQLFDQIFLNEVEQHLPKTPFFLIDFPSRISPLCQPRADKPYLAQRFELFIGGVELGNGNTENTDVSYVGGMFRRERAERKRRHLPCPPEDTEFLSALKKMQGKSYAGIGLGVDRLCLLLSSPERISESVHRNYSSFSQLLPSPPTHSSVGGVPRSGHFSE